MGIIILPIRVKVASGEVQEWLNWTVSKTVMPAMVSRVQIPPSPPIKLPTSKVGYFICHPSESWNLRKDKALLKL